MFENTNSTETQSMLAAGRPLPGAETQSPVAIDSAGVNQGNTNGFLQGERQVGAIPLPNGNTLVHEVTGDGMKQTRIAGPRAPQGYRTAAEFHAAAGVATAAEQAAVASNDTLTSEKPGGLRKLGRRIASFVLGSHNKPQN